MKSPRLNARIAGFLYLVVVVASTYALVTISGLSVRGDAAATARNILAAEQTYRIAFAANLISAVAYVAVVAILYELFKPVSRTLSAVAAFIGLAGCTISGVVMANQLVNLHFLGADPSLSAFTSEQLHGLARASQKSQGLGNSIGLVFFGFYCLSLGTLVLGAKFLPRLLGFLLIAAGAGWLIGNFGVLVVPDIGGPLSRTLLPVSGLCETLFCLWLLVMGIDAEKWRAQAGET